MSAYRTIMEHYERCLKQHGDTHKGVDWPNAEEAQKRYAIMLDGIRPQKGPVKLLDFGCGAAHLLDYLQSYPRQQIDYTGLDLSLPFIELCRKKYPSTAFYCVDVLEMDLSQWYPFDFAILNGVLTEKRELSFDVMWDYAKRLLKTLFSMVDHGLAFNVMSKQVDWERADLFHLPFDVLAHFLTKELSRHFQIRNDYGLYEYTVYVYKEPTWPKS